MKEAETDNNAPVFSIKTPFSKDANNLRQRLFKSKWKNFSIQQGDKLLIKLHPEVLDEDFPETLEIFESHNQIVSLPPELNAETLDFLVKFFYFREIAPPISLPQTFQLLNLAVFFKVEPLVKEIQKFLLPQKLENEEEKREASEVILKNVEISEKCVPTFSRETIKCGYLTLSNSNRTVEKINGSNWTGIRCTTVENTSSSMLRSPDKQIFSIKIEKTQDATIMFGFCVKSAECEAEAFREGVYWNTRFSFVLDLYSSYCYFRSSRSKFTTTTNLKQTAINTQGVFSASIDTNKKTVKFYLDGKLLASEIEIDLTPEEAQMMCPCVDLYDEGDRVSLVFQEVE